MIRRIVLVLTIGAMMAGLLMTTGSPAMADHRHDHFDHHPNRGFFDHDRDFFVNDFDDSFVEDFDDFDDEDFDDEELEDCEFFGFEEFGEALFLCEVDFD